MNIGLFLIFSIIAIYSLLFTIHRYRKATPAQRRKIIWASCGAVAFTVTIALFIGLR